MNDTTIFILLLDFLWDFTIVIVFTPHSHKLMSVSDQCKSLPLSIHSTDHTIWSYGINMITYELKIWIKVLHNIESTYNNTYVMVIIII